ncbi:MAG: hypothetical protein JNJ54_16615 [Myxococcaceae bacterium]|nr:hypothetical protein [Myxococcaceae bacterium]
MTPAVLALLVVAAPDGERPPPEDPARFRADLALLCGVEAKSGAAGLKDPARRAEKIAAFLAKQEFGPDYDDFFAELSNSEPDNKPSFLLTFARLAGLKACAFAERSQRELLADFQMKCARKAPPESDANDGSAASQPWCDRVAAVKTLWNVAKQTQPRPR